MKQNVMVRIRSEQQYEEEAPDISDFLTLGTIEQTEKGIAISYEESELTGLQGTTTTFQLERDRIVLKREGTLRSEMIFAINQEHRSLYDMGMGAMMITVRTMALVQAMSMDGGMIQVEYDLLVEDCYVGQVSYRILVTPTGREES